MYREEQHVHLYENSFEHPTDDQDYPLYFGPYSYWTHFEVADLEAPNSRRVMFRTGIGTAKIEHP